MKYVFLVLLILCSLFLGGCRVSDLVAVPDVPVAEPVVATLADYAALIEENSWLGIYGWETMLPAEDGEQGTILVWYVRADTNMFRASGLTEDEGFVQSGIALSIMIDMAMRTQGTRAVAIVFLGQANPGAPMQIGGVAFLELEQIHAWIAGRESVTPLDVLEFVSNRYEDMQTMGMVFVPLTEDFELHHSEG